MRRSLVWSAFFLCAAACGGNGKVKPPEGLRPDASMAIEDAGPGDAGKDASADGGLGDGGTKPFQPSSGAELKPPPPKFPTKEESRAYIAARLAKARAPKPECKDLVDAQIPMHLSFARYERAEVVKDEEAWITVARCAERKQSFMLLQAVAATVAAADPVNGHPELVARALIGANRLESARKLVDDLLKARATDPWVRNTAAKLACREQRWQACKDYGDQTLTMATSVAEPERSQIMLRAEKYRGRALLHLGKLDEASAAMDRGEKLGIEREDIVEFRSELASARTSSMIVDPSFSPEVPLGVYHLYGKQSNPLVKLDIENMAAKDRQLRIEIEIPGVTERSVKTVMALKSSTTKVEITPPLKTAFDVRSIRANQAAQLNIKVVDLGPPEKVVEEQGFPLTLMSRDFLPMCQYTTPDRNACTPTPQFFAAWITPNAKAIDTFLAAAKKRLPKRAFVGLQGPTVPQVQAIYDELKERGMSYVMDPYVLSDGHFGQRTRLPSEILESTNAQCLEGTLLYATLLEAIGLAPVIVRVPGHAFVGWHAHPTERTAPRELYYLETTMTHSATFAEAIERAAKEADPVERSGKTSPTAAPLMKGMYDRIEVNDLRKKGITSQPYD